jgi:PBSX family phage terminase large subunit
MIQFEYSPNPVFVPFHASAAADRFLFGGYGSGKTVAACAEAIAWGLECPGMEMLITRKTVPALRDTTEKEFINLLPPEFWKALQADGLVSRAGGHLNTVEFPNGSRFYFRGLDDWRKLRSMNLAAILWDEADEFEREEFEGMQSRIRQVHPTPRAKEQGAPQITRRGNIVSSNPQGHNWLWEECFGKKVRPGVEAFISTSFDNPYLPVETLKRWLAMPDPWVRRYVMCSFDEFAGAIFTDWSWETHVIPPFKDSAGKYKYDPSSWFRMGFDPGTSSGNAGVWVYYDKPKHRYVVVAEYCEEGLSVTAHTRAWRAIEVKHGMRVQKRIGDPKAITQRDRGSTERLDRQYARKGFRFQLGPSGVDDRLTSMGELIAQGRLVVTSECPRTYEQILNYQWEDLSPAQRARGKSAKPLKKDVDLVDATQMATSNYVPPPKVKPAGSPEEQHSREVHAAIRKQRAKRRARKGRPQHDLGGMPV